MLINDKNLQKLPNNYIKIAGIEPNFAIANNYRAKLFKMVKAMLKNVIDAVMQDYKKNQNQFMAIVGDSAIDNLYNLITLKMGYWEMLFKIESPKLATNFVNKVNKNINYQFMRNAAPIKTSFPDLYAKFKINISKDTKSLLLSKEAAIKDNVALITNMTQDASKKIHSAVMEASSRGRDAKYLRAELMKIDNMTKNRAKLIANDQLGKVTNVLDTAKQVNLGINENVWHHSRAGKEPRKSHVEANGKIFKLDKGCLIDGEYIYPGQKINCRCYSAPIIKLY